MVAPHFFSQLVLLARLGLGLRGPLAWPGACLVEGPRPPPPAPSPRQRARGPNPFPGLPRTPQGDAGVHALAGLRLALPATPPPALVAPRGRRRDVATARPVCPDADGRYGGGLGLGPRNNDSRHPPSALVQGDRLEAFQVGWAKHHAFGEGLATMRLDKAVGCSPGKKCLFRGPGRMRHVVNGTVVALPA